jgi:hypothetical protein
MLNSGSALHPKEVGLIRLQPLLILSKDKSLLSEVKDFIKNEFDDYIYIIEEAYIEGDLEFEKYKLHILSFEDQKAVLKLRNGTKIEDIYEDLEDLLEKFGRELIKYYHESFR